tara:strand:+ start:361 stop:510 length:150 start_codon:yes stop_codon:yes gene_type:complete
MTEHENLTTMEQIKEAFSFYTRNPRELLGDLVGVIALLGMLVTILTFGG